jgi:hypothetical protein
MATPRLPADFAEFLRLLDAHGVDYLVVGGYAVAFHGHPRATQDLDVWLRRDLATAERVVEVLRAFGFDAPELRPELFLDPERLVRLGEPPMRLELLTSVSGLDFEESHRRAVRTELEGVPVAIVSLPDLRANKRAAGRPRDLADLEELPEA